MCSVPHSAPFTEQAFRARARGLLDGGSSPAQAVTTPRAKEAMEAAASTRLLPSSSKEGE